MQDEVPSRGWYDARAAALSASYESARPAAVLGWMDGLVPAAPALIVDIGAGTGRDAAWFASAGHDVVAAEPSAGMRSEGARLHASPRITWIDDALPGLPLLSGQGLAADLVFACGVWQHVAPADRPRALRAMASLLRPGGALALSLRHGPDDPARHAHPVCRDELESIARSCGLRRERVAAAPDVLGREDVSWTNVAFRLVEGRAGRFPLPAWSPGAMGSGAQGSAPHMRNPVSGEVLPDPVSESIPWQSVSELIPWYPTTLSSFQLHYQVSDSITHTCH